MRLFKFIVPTTDFSAQPGRVAVVVAESREDAVLLVHARARLLGTDPRWLEVAQVEEFDLAAPAVVTLVELGAWR